MNWFQRFVRRLAGGHDARYHRQASELTARKLESKMRQMRVEQLHKDALAMRLQVRTTTGDDR